MKKSTLKFSFEKIFIVVAVCFALIFESPAQTITADPVVTTESNLYTDIELWISAPAGEEVNAVFNYFTAGGDTLVSATLSNLAMGFSQQFVFQDIVVGPSNCDLLWQGYVDVWITGQDTIQSDSVLWSLPCPSDVSLDFQVEEIVDLGAVVSFDYNTGGALAALYWFTSIDGGIPFLQTVLLFGEGTYSDTLLISAGQTYEFCNPEINNGLTNPLLILDCLSGTMDSFVPTVPDVALLVELVNDTLTSSFTIENSGGLNSEFVVMVEKMLCEGAYEPYEDFVFTFTEVVVDSLISVPILFNLPNAPAWRVTVSGSNENFGMTPVSTIIDVALTASPTVSLDLTALGNGFYEAETSWDDDNAGDVVLLYYVNDELVGQIVPMISPVVFEIPTQISSYSGGTVEVILASNACSVSATMQTIPVCGNDPTHILETATNITETSANVQLAYVNFSGCVEQALVGIILVGIDTVWSPLSVNTEESSNYIVQLTNLIPGQTYVYLGVLYAEGEYFTTNFSLSFTTLSDEPIPPSFTNFSVNWDLSMLITIFMYYDLGDFSSVGLRVYHDGPGNPAVEIAEIPVTNEFTSIDYNLFGQYGTHMVWAELYDTGTNEIFETTDVSIHTFQPDEPVSPSFTNFSVNWDPSMIVTIFMYYDLGDFSSVGLRVYHDGPGSPATEIAEIPVSNEFTSLDVILTGQYGTHIVWAELYDTGTNVVFETTDASIHTFQQPIGVTEIGRTIERFDRIEVYNLAGQLVGNYRNGEVLDPNFSQGIYLFVAWKEGESTTSKLSLN